MRRKFSFDNLEPSEISSSLNRIESSKFYKGRTSLAFSENDFKESLNKLIYNKSLTEKDYLILLSFLERIEKKQIYKLLNNLKDSPIRNNIVNKGLKLIMDNVYSDVLAFKQKELLYNMIYNYFVENQHLKRNLDLGDKIIKSDNLSLYLDCLKKDISSLRYNPYTARKFSFDSYIRNYYIKNSSEYYFRCLSIYLKNNYLDNEVWKSNEKSIKAQPLEKRNKIIKSILWDLYCNRQKIDISEYPDEFFFLVEYFLGEDISSTKWESFTDKEKSIYITWTKDKSIRKFFNDISQEGDAARLKFWRQYLDSVIDIYHHETLNNILIMEFKNHLIVEFAERSNATYIYNKDNLSMEKAKEVALSNIGKHEKIRFFKNKVYFKNEVRFDSVKKLNHSGRWQVNFERNLNILGYRKDRY